VESSIVSFADPERPTLLRPGGLARQEIEVVTGPLEGPAQHASTPTSPGQLDSHYAPNARVRLNADTPHVDEAYLAFGPYRGEGAHHRFDLSASGDLGEAAARLFTGLRLLDTKAGKIAVAPIDNTGLGEAINDRLKRAAAQR
jgi:L-threonylcarbamoyladenylate synthase